nr:hypothetical protein [Burkholderiales bacterium]
TKIEFKRLTVDTSKYPPQPNQLNPSYLPPKVRELLLNDQFGVHYPDYFIKVQALLIILFTSSQNLSQENWMSLNSKNLFTTTNA